MNRADLQKRERRHQEDLQRLRGFRPIDDTFMRGLFKDNLPLAEFVLRILTDKPDLVLTKCETQADMKRVTGARSICLDAYATDSTGTKYLVIELPESMTEPGNTAVRQAIANGGVQATITYRAKESMTLLPAAAVRSDGNSSYVFLVQQSGGGFLSSNGMKVVKTTVTVADKNDKQVAVQEDFSYQQLAYQEDRALSDGMAVMEYVN